MAANSGETRTLAATEHVTTIQQEKGKITIADGVVAKIAGLAVREVPGVHALIASGKLQQAVANLARTVTRQEGRDTGVGVEVGEKEAAIDVRISVDYGVNIPAVAAGVRNNVISRVESMTGLIVKEVNVEVLDLFFPGEEPAPITKRVE